jgi:DTW domain-containing protein YfiP
MPPAEGYFCTLEAAIIALEVLGEIETASTLARIMDVVRRRLLFARGRIPPGELTPAEIKG